MAKRFSHAERFLEIFDFMCLLIDTEAEEGREGIIKPSSILKTVFDNNCRNQMCRLKMPINRPIEGLFIWGLTIWQISARSIDRDVFKLIFTKVIQ